MPMNPYQGLKQLKIPLNLQIGAVTMPMNPYQGLKHVLSDATTIWLVGHNANESLSGIETQIVGNLPCSQGAAMSQCQ